MLEIHLLFCNRNNAMRYSALQTTPVWHRADGQYLHYSTVLQYNTEKISSMFHIGCITFLISHQWNLYFTFHYWRRFLSIDIKIIWNTVRLFNSVPSKLIYFLKYSYEVKYRLQYVHWVQYDDWIVGIRKKESMASLL